MSGLGASMASGTPLWRGLLPLLACALLATQDAVVNAFGAACKPVVVTVLGAFGLATRDEGLAIHIEQLQVPWTADCAGMNLLLVLLAVFTWMHRDVPQDRAYWLRLALMFPAAIAANVLRVLTLVAYRFAFYPEVESPQLHYFMGFLWLVPIALLAIPRHTGRPRLALWFELLHISAVIGLLAPLLSLADHWVTAVGVLLCLLHARFADGMTIRTCQLLTGWVVSGAVIAWAGIESLWLPWLLVCPLVANHRWYFSLSGVGCLAAACPLSVMLPGADWIAATLFAWVGYQLYVGDREADIVINTSRPQYRWMRPVAAALAPLLMLPFLASVLFAAAGERLQPPSVAAQRTIAGQGYELKLPGQPAELGLLWYDPQGSDRHHKVEVCLQYRGIDLTPSEVAAVKTDGQYWFREYFLVRGELIANHSDYVWQTLGFRRDPGVHLILVADRQHLTAEAFAAEAAATVDQLYASLL